MRNGTVWTRLTDEQRKLFADPSEECFNWMVEAHRNALAHRCLETAARQRIEELETLVLTMRQLHDADCKAHRIVLRQYEELSGDVINLVSELTVTLNPQVECPVEERLAAVRRIEDRLLELTSDRG